MYTLLEGCRNLPAKTLTKIVLQIFCKVVVGSEICPLGQGGQPIADRCRRGGGITKKWMASNSILAQMVHKSFKRKTFNEFIAIKKTFQ